MKKIIVPKFDPEGKSLMSYSLTRGTSGFDIHQIKHCLRTDALWDVIFPMNNVEEQEIEN